MLPSYCCKEVAIPLIQKLRSGLSHLLFCSGAVLRLPSPPPLRLRVARLPVRPRRPREAANPPDTGPGSSSTKPPRPVVQGTLLPAACSPGLRPRIRRTRWGQAVLLARPHRANSLSRNETETPLELELLMLRALDVADAKCLRAEFLPLRVVS